MTDHDPKTPKPSPTRVRIVAVAAGAALLIGGALGVQAIAGSKTYQHAKAAVTEAHWTGGDRGWRRAGGRHGGGFASLSEDELVDRIDRLSRHAAIEVEATEEQRLQIVDIVTAVAKELQPLRAEMRETGREMKDLLLQDVIDRAAVEALRAERVAELEAISKTVSEGLLDVAEVLTPEQRALLEERINEFGFMGRHGRRG